MGSRRTSPKGRPTASRKEHAAAARGRQRRQRRRTGLVIGAAVAVLVGLVVIMTFHGSERGVTDPEAFDLPAIEGDERIRLDDHRGRPVVVNFFASWCTACDQELPGFARVSDEHRDEVAFVGVNSQETGGRMTMPERHGVDWWPLAKDVGGPFTGGSGLWTSLGGGRGLPGTAFYDDAGTLLEFHSGVLSEPQLRANLARHYGVGA